MNSQSPRIISIFNQAGGVAKTTLTHNLGYHLAKRQHRVLLIDIDPQASLTKFMGKPSGSSQHAEQIKEKGVFTMSTVRKQRDEIPPMSEERAKELLAMSDDDIDYSDIPELDEEFFKNAKLVERKPRTEAISIRIDTEVLQWFKSHAKEKGYQTLINDVLRTYVNHHKNPGI
jgi:cellulose biosynthesis protein BcsQ